MVTTNLVPSKGLVAGSFDPITNGHVWLIKQALQIVDKLVVVVGVNPSKKYMFSSDERVDMVEQVLRDELLNDFTERVSVIPLQGELLVNYAHRENISTLIRGIRNTTDFSYESEMLLINKKIQPTIETFFVIPPRHLTEVSSSTVKGLVGFGGWQQSVTDYIHPIILKKLEVKHGKTTQASK